jgi:hypothetical protein
VSAPFDFAWLERELQKSIRAQLVPGIVLTVFWIAGMIVSLRRGWQGEWVGMLVLTLLAGVPGLWLLKGGLASAATHPVLLALRDDPKRVTSVNLEWRGGGNHFIGRVVIQVAGMHAFRLLTPRGREEELVAWVRAVRNGASEGG